MNLQELAKILKSLSATDREQLATEHLIKVETICPQGYVLNAQGVCVPDVGK